MLNRNEITGLGKEDGRAAGRRPEQLPRSGHLNSPVFILTLCFLELNSSLTVNTSSLSISLEPGSLVRTL